MTNGNANSVDYPISGVSEFNDVAHTLSIVSFHTTITITHFIMCLERIFISAICH